MSTDMAFSIPGNPIIFHKIYSIFPADMLYYTKSHPSTERTIFMKCTTIHVTPANLQEAFAKADALFRKPGEHEVTL